MRRYLIAAPYAMRALLRQYGLISTVVLTLSITLGALFSVFSINYTFNYQPLPYKDAQTLYVAKARIADKDGNIFASTYSYPSLVELYKNQTYFKSAAIFTRDYDVVSSLPNQPKVRLTFATPEFGALFSMPMSHGQFMSNAQGLNTFEPVAVISHKIWQSMFNSRSDILDQSILLSNVSYKIIGVADENYFEPILTDPGDTTDIWLPWEFNYKRKNFQNDWGNVQGLYYLVGSLSSGITPQQVSKDLSKIASTRWQDENRANAFFNGMTLEIELQTLREAILGDSRHVVTLLFLGTMGLLLVAITNLSNAFISRIAQLNKEFAIRATLGAKPLDLFARFLVETISLSLASSLFGLVLGVIGLAVVRKLLLEVLPMVDMMRPNAAMIIFAFVCTILIAVFFAGLAVASIKYRQLMNSLRGSGKGMGIQVSAKIRSALIVSQVTIAIVLLFGNIHLFKDAMAEVNKPIGFETNHLASVSFFFRTDNPPNKEEIKNITHELIEKLESSPQVGNVSNARAPFYAAGKWSFNSVGDNKNFMPLSLSIDENFLPILDLKVIEGEAISRDDMLNEAPVMLVNHTFARILSQSHEVVGSNLLRFGSQLFEIKGVIKDIAMPGDTPDVPRAYVAEVDRFLYFILKFEPDTGFSRDWLVEQVQSVHPLLSVYNFDFFEAKIAKAQQNARFLARITASLALLVIFLTAIGLLELVSYSVKLRQIEMAIRFSIGAKYTHLLRMLLKENVGLILLAIAISFAVILLCVFSINDTSLKFSIYSVFSFIATTLIVAGIMLIACAIPLYRLYKKTVINILKGDA